MANLEGKVALVAGGADRQDGWSVVILAGTRSQPPPGLRSRFGAGSSRVAQQAPAAPRERE
jgi:hypothetical protein